MYFLLIIQIRPLLSQPNDQEAWRSLLNFGGSILRKPTRTGKHYNLSSSIKNTTIAGEVDLIDDRLLSLAPLKKKNADDMLAAAVTAKVEDRNIKAALRTLCLKKNRHRCEGFL